MTYGIRPWEMPRLRLGELEKIRDDQRERVMQAKREAADYG